MYDKAQYYLLQIEIPKEINDHIKNAKRYQEYLDAKEERRRFFEKTMDDRIAAMAQSKVEAQLKSVASGIDLKIIHSYLNSPI